MEVPGLVWDDIYHIKREREPPMAMAAYFEGQAGKRGEAVIARSPCDEAIHVSKEKKEWIASSLRSSQ
jgi:hypothetical protein